MKKSICIAALAAFAMSMALSGQVINVTSPTASDDWCIGTTYSITWTKSGTMPNRVTIRLRRAGSPDSEAAALVISAETDNNMTNMTFRWPIPNSVAPDEYFIRIKTVGSPEGTPEVSGDSPNFTIRNCGSAPPGRPSRDLELKKFWYTANDGGCIIAKVRNTGKPIDTQVDFHVMFPSGGPGDRVISKRLTLGNNEEKDVCLYDLPPRRFPLLGVLTRVTVDGPVSRVNESNEGNNTLQTVMGIVDVSTSLPRSEMEIIDHGNYFILRYTIRVRHNLDRVLSDIQVAHQIYHINGTQLLYTFNIHNLGPGEEFHKTFENVFFIKNIEIFRVDEPCSLKRHVVYHIHAVAQSWRWKPYEMYLDINDDNNWASIPFMAPD